MDKKIYDLMNWPDIEGIVYSESDNPHALLGAHMCKDGMLIQVFRPDAVEVTILVDGKKKKYPMEKVDEAGYFAVCIPGKKRLGYRVVVENLQGKKEEYIDPYAFETLLDDKFLTKFQEGGCFEIYKQLGAHKRTVDGVEGIHFVTWAPNAMRVSVIGDFNRYDGRVLQMRKIPETGLFELFVPGLSEDITYQYEVKERRDIIHRKTDPYAMRYQYENAYAAYISTDTAVHWKDASWQKYKKEQADLSDKPFAVCELSQEQYATKNIVEFAERISKMGFTHVELMPPCSYIREDSFGYETLGFFAPNKALGTMERFCAVVDAFHQQNIGVLIDMNFAFFGTESVGMTLFDGTNLYEMFDARLDKHPNLKVATFDYEKPQVCQMLLSAAVYWAKECHVDGFRIDEVASMLYLDYGRGPGEWVPNIYGENINLAAIDFLHALRKILDKKCPNTLLIAEDSSAWPKVTGNITEDSLGFDYKWNYGWKEDFLTVMEQDPLFRKGVYGKLTYSMLYHYSEQYMLMLSHEEFGKETADIEAFMPGNEQDKRANVRLAYGYMYTHPGKKLLNLYQSETVSAYLQTLNTFYQKNPALYEQDYESGGFAWVDNAAADETVLAYERHSEQQTLLIVANFTPVARENYRLGVLAAGKYTEVFNSDAAVFGGENHINEHMCESEIEECKGKNQSIVLNVPPLGITVLEYEPYTEIELEKMKIVQEAKQAKIEAQKQAEEAELRKLEAEKEAEYALEAQRQAEAAAKKALMAQQEAEEKAAAAKKASKTIETKMKKKLQALDELEEKHE